MFWKYYEIVLRILRTFLKSITKFYENFLKIIPKFSYNLLETYENFSQFWDLIITNVDNT